MSVLNVFILFIIICVAVIWYLAKTKKPLLPNAFKRYCVGFYSIVLIVATLLVYILPDTGLAQGTDNDQKQRLAAAQRVDYNLRALIKQEQSDGSNGVYRNLSQEFTLDAGVLTINPDNTDIEIWIERKTSADGKIEAKSYVTTHLVEGADFSSKIRPPELELDGNTLQVRSPERYTLKYYAVKSDLIFAQFRDSTPGVAFGGGSTFFGRQVLLLSVPAGMEVRSGYSNIVYVD